MRFVLFLVALGTLGLLLAGVKPQAEEMESSEPAQVREDEIELYIKVYTAMQDDHDLTIENAIRPYQTSLESFRQVERRIQSQPRLVDRVRQALLEHAKANSVFAQSLGTPTPAATPADRTRGERRR
jgi:ABC-type transport system involved in cytochrome bd biosynthesis fused ATPase/permease subunit